MIDLTDYKCRKGKPVGLPYQGSKKKVSKRLFQFFIDNHHDFTFYDVFAGGLAMTAEAIIHNIPVNANIYDNRIVMILDYLYSDKYNIFDVISSREKFIQTRNKENKNGLDYAILLINSFGNNFKSYLYNSEISDLKYSVAVEILEKYGTGKDYKQTDIFKRNENKLFSSDTKEKHKIIQSLEKLQQLQQLQQLEQLKRLERLKINNLDYKNIKINDKKAVVYLDPPYWDCNFNGYNGIDFYEFVAWVKTIKARYIYISHYNNALLAKHFGEPYIIFPKSKSTLQSGTNKNNKFECVYRIKSVYANYNDNNNQINLFDYETTSS